MTRTAKQREEKAVVKTESKPVDPVKAEVDSLVDNLDTIPPTGDSFEQFEAFRKGAEASERDPELAAAMAAEDEARSLAAEREREALSLDPIEKMRRATGIQFPDPNR